MRRATFFVSLLGTALSIGLAPLLVAASAIPAPTPPPPLAPIDFKHLPWVDGETLTYLVSWAAFDAAQGIFTASNKSDHWEFKLDLASKGLVDSFYPFTGTFWSVIAPPPWRSAEYSEYRFEPRRTIRERTRIDYSAHQATREIWSEGKTKTYSIAEDAIDDVGSMLYHIRAASWQPGDKRTIFVYEDNSEKEGLIECQSRETRAFGTWPAQPLLRISALPGKGTHHRGHLMLWMTDDARHLPLHAELDFRYGSFSIDLTHADKTLPIAH